MRRLLALVVAALLAAAGVSTAQAKSTRVPSRHLLVRDGRIVDERGRTVLLRGVNVNQLNDGGQLDPLSGTAVLNGIAVDIAPAG